MKIRDAIMIIESAEQPAPPSGFPPVLKDCYAIADYIEELATSPVDNEFMVEYFRGTKAVLRLVPVTDLTQGDPSTNIPSKAKAKRYAKMDVATMPPLVVDEGKVVDGNHRFRDGLTKGLSAFWCYVIEAK